MHVVQYRYHIIISASVIYAVSLLSPTQFSSEQLNAYVDTISQLIAIHVHTGYC